MFDEAYIKDYVLDGYEQGNPVFEDLEELKLDDATVKRIAEQASRNVLDDTMVRERVYDAIEEAASSVLFENK